MSPTWPLVIFFLYFCLLTEGKMAQGQKNGKPKITSDKAKKSQNNKVSHRNKWWLIETTNNEEDEPNIDEVSSDEEDDIANTDINNRIRAIYQADINSIRNLSKLANNLINDG